MVKLGLFILVATLALAGPAKAQPDAAALANDLLGPSFIAPVYICPGSMDLLHVMEETSKEISPKAVSRTLERALHARSCHREVGRFAILQTYEVTEVNQGIGHEFWFQLMLQAPDGRTVYALVGVNQD